MKLNKQQKKDRLIDMIKELANMMVEAPNDFTANKMKPILLGLLKETLDVKKSLIYINLNFKESKSILSKVFWSKIIGIINKYFEDLK